ncbi:hypothetical protein FRC10_004902 [Ceratobasidium sp. 414]|nr:hypothetical protein FRC10_004902 [Ceratobasidium sp. 414]
MALRARYGPGNRAWSYQRPADDTTNGPPLQPSAFGLALSAEDHTPAPEGAPEQLVPATTAVDAVRAASGAAKARTRSDAGASSTAAARAARAAKASAARSARASTGSTPAVPPPPGADPAPRRRSGRVPATTAKARAPSPTHTAAPQRTAKRKRSTLVPDVPGEPGADSESAPAATRSGVLAPLNTAAAAPDAGASRTTRGAGAKRPRVSQKDVDVQPPRPDESDESKRTTFGSTTTAPDPFTALSATDWTPTQEQNAQAQPEPAAATEATDAPRMRRLPSGVPLHNILKGLYRRYPVSQVGLPKEVIANVPDLDKAVVMPPNTIPNAAPFLNLYAPRRTRGIGADKHGLCPICAEPPSRGGRGKAMMLNMKLITNIYTLFPLLILPGPVSYWILPTGLSPKTGLPFSPPIAFRAASRKTVGAREKATLEEGLCHACSRWIVVEGVKAVDVLVPEIYWWKHASTCHKSRMLEGEGDFYIEDPLFLRIVQWQRDHPTAAGREPTRAGSANVNNPVAKEAGQMDVEMSAPNAGPSARHGAITPVRRDLEDPDSSPLSSLDGTDAASPARRASAPTLQFPPTARGPFAPQSPSTAHGRSAEGGIGGGTMAIGIPPPHVAAHMQQIGFGTPQLANHALPGTLPGTPQTTASVTPVLGGTALPGVHGVEGDPESRSVVDSGVALSPHDHHLGRRSDEDAEGEDEDADADAEGEDDPTATAENTPVLTQLPVLTPNLVQVVMSAPLSVPVDQPAPMSGVEQEHVANVPLLVPDVASQVPNMEAEALTVGMQAPAIGQALSSLTSVPEAQACAVEQASHIATESAPTAVLATVPPVETAQVPVQAAQVPVQPVVPTEVQVPALENHVPAEAPQPIVSDAVVPAPEAHAAQQPSVPAELAILVEVTGAPIIPPEFPNIMDMYASNNTPDESGNPQLVLTEEDLALASSGLALDNPDIELTTTAIDLGADLLLGENMDISGTELQIPAAPEAALAESRPAGAQPGPEPVQGLSVPGLGLSSGEGTPNAGAEADMFAFWDAT